MQGKMLLPHSQVLRSGVIPLTNSKPAHGHRQIVRAKEVAEGSSGEDKKKSVPKSEDKVQKQEESKPAKSDGFNRPRNKLFLASEQSLGYLDGTLPGDFGFDPLGLSDPEAKPDAGAGEGFISPSWLSYAEVYHGRWAMLGAAGCIFPEIFAKLNIIPQTPAEVTWFRAGVIPPAGSYTYWTDAYTLFFLELILFNFVEIRRFQDYRKPGSMSKQYLLGLEKGLGGTGNPTYPGGLFNPLGFGRSEASMNELKLKEIKNGRLAMVAMLGYSGQAVMTGVGPFQNLQDHVGSPTGQNILTNFQSFGYRT